MECEREKNIKCISFEQFITQQLFFLLLFSHHTSSQCCKARRFGLVAPAIFKYATEKENANLLKSTGSLSRTIWNVWCVVTTEFWERHVRCRCRCSIPCRRHSAGVYLDTNQSTAWTKSGHTLLLHSADCKCLMMPLSDLETSHAVIVRESIFGVGLLLTPSPALAAQEHVVRPVYWFLSWIVFLWFLTFHNSLQAHAVASTQSARHCNVHWRVCSASLF